ncbi:DUF1523 family protein [Xinfangfangia sp. D13-10-4-6]|uniref:DUF1523 family protein n=1 Tax=Pseudogemmobacter hezensis TaxID=2737662 RepID=UPI001553E364|nr:DUF1523 family protein [Pseudogemmobacter hezensis]NPD13850.1 DUF1523 family protein [Pseudogemmobacter hezensis]
MKYVKWTLWTLLAAFVAAFLHYNLPHHDIVRIVKVENKMVEIGENSIFWSRADVGMTNSNIRDVSFIYAVYPDGRPIEFRNEDTGWGWPPYFKIDSGRLITQASDLVSTANDPVWVNLTHYGWRNALFSIYPNAISATRVEGPDVTIIPWVNIIILATLVFVIFMLWRMWVQFRERMIDPAMVRAEQAINRVDASMDEARAGARGVWGRFSAWLDTWKSKPKR